MMQTTIHISQPGKAPEQAAMTHEQKRDMIRRCIEEHAQGKNIWMTYSDIAECTGMSRKDVIKTVYESVPCFLESTWRMSEGEIMATVRQLYEDRTSFIERLMATFTGQWD